MKSKKQTKREARQLTRLCLVNDLLDENRTRNVAQHLAAAGYRDCPAILAHFLRLVRLDRARHTANIESATPLPADLQASIRASLTRRFGAGLTTVFASRPALIGGVRIQVGSDVYDGSVLAGLRRLERVF
jgi:F-type H+-transporting ATPase subunit delta